MSNSDALKTLLFKFADFCENNQLQYTILDDAARCIHENHGAFKNVEYISVGMTRGDIDRMFKINSINNNSFFSLESPLNNPYAKKMQFRIYDHNNTLFKAKEYDEHLYQGCFIDIKPIDHLIDSKYKRKLLKFINMAWRGSRLDLKACNIKRKIPVAILKMITLIFGGKNSAARIVYNYNSKLKYIDSWDDIGIYQQIRIGKRKFNVDESMDLEHIYIEGHKLLILNKVLNRTIVHNTKPFVDDIYIGMPYHEIIDDELKKDIIELKRLRDIYYKSLQNTRRVNLEIKRSWNIYLMSRDVISIRKMYSKDMITIVKEQIEKKDSEMYYELMSPYLKSRVRWKKKGIPYIYNDDLENVITDAKIAFRNINKEDSLSVDDELESI